MVAATAGRVPKTFKSRLQRALYDTPTARQEAEEAERPFWLQVLALLVERSPTPMGNLLARQPGSRLALLGAGRREATLRNRVRLLRNYFSWLAATHEVSYPTSLEHFVGFLRARASEPANRGALRNVNRTFTFLHEVTGTEQVNRLTATHLYDAVYREILASCELGRPVKQPLRFLVGLLALVEDFVTTVSNPANMRMYGWWVLLQSWGTMRFSDHRGLSPADISFTDGSLIDLSSARVSARIMTDRRLQQRILMSKFRWLRLGRGSSRRWFAGVDQTTGRNLALNAEIIYFPISVGEESVSVHRLCRNLCVCFLHSIVFPFSLSLARATEYGLSLCLRFTCVLLISRFLPFPRIGRIYGAQKLLRTLMSLSKLPRHFDEAIKNFLVSLMSHQALTARHNQVLLQVGQAQ